MLQCTYRKTDNGGNNVVGQRWWRHDEHLTCTELTQTHCSIVNNKTNRHFLLEMLQQMLLLLNWPPLAHNLPADARTKHWPDDQMFSLLTAPKDRISTAYSVKPSFEGGGGILYKLWLNSFTILTGAPLRGTAWTCVRLIIYVVGKTILVIRSCFFGTSHYPWK